MPDFYIIVIGASAGGVEALINLAKHLPEDINAAIFITVHFSEAAPSVLPAILRRHTRIPVSHAQDQDKIERGHIYIAKPGKHLVLMGARVRQTYGPKENRNRPAIDPMFRTAARSYGPRVIGVILTGMLDDGTAGLRAIKDQGGIAVVQDPADALYGGMPRNAISNVNVDYVLPLSEIPALLAELTQREIVVTDVTSKQSDVEDDIALELESEIADMDATDLHNTEQLGPPSQYSCPECGGVLWEVHDKEHIRYRCRVGHAYSPDTLLTQQSETLEAALWSALRALEEKVSLTRRMAGRARQGGQHLAADNLDERARDAEQNATKIFKVLHSTMPELEAHEGKHDQRRERKEPSHG